MKSQETFDHFLYLLFPEGNLDPVRNAIGKKYNVCKSQMFLRLGRLEFDQSLTQRMQCQGETFDGDFRKCIATVIRDYTFTCNTRQLFDSFSNSSYMMKYGFHRASRAQHSYDLIPTFSNENSHAYTMLQDYGIPAWLAKSMSSILEMDVKRVHKAYLSSFGVHQDPNVGKHKLGSEWPLATQGEQIGNVMEVYGQGTFQLISDDQNTKTACDFWICIAKMIDALQNSGPVDAETLQLMSCD